ncbi:hypothetical protein D9M71_761480 [compost metagenome]
MPEAIDHLLGIRGSIGHDSAAFPSGLQSLGNLLGVLDIGGDYQTGCIRLDLAKLVQLGATQAEQPRKPGAGGQPTEALGFGEGAEQGEQRNAEQGERR